MGIANESNNVDNMGKTLAIDKYADENENFLIVSKTLG
jgi:hypothetical protein